MGYAKRQMMVRISSGGRRFSALPELPVESGIEEHRTPSAPPADNFTTLCGSEVLFHHWIFYDGCKLITHMHLPSSGMQRNRDHSTIACISDK